MQENKTPSPVDRLANIGRGTEEAAREVGFASSLLVESLYWIVMGRFRYQPVRMASVIEECMEIGIRALPIITIMSITIGAMLAIQGIYSLRAFGAESQVTIGIAYSVVREFAPLLTGILVAGRSGSALAARLGTMTISQEIDALRGMGINPVRFLVVPSLIAMLLMVPALTVWCGLIALLGGGLYVSFDLGMSLDAYFNQVLDTLGTNDVWHGVGKSAIFAVLITLVGVVNGARVTGGAEGVGKATTRSVVMAISAIVVTDMLFAFMVTRFG